MVLHADSNLVLTGHADVLMQEQGGSHARHPPSLLSHRPSARKSTYLPDVLMQEQGGSQNHNSPLKSKSNAKRTRVKITSSNVDKELIKLNIAPHSNTYIKEQQQR